MLRLRGEKSLAAFEEQRLGTRYQANRADLGIEQAASTVVRSLQQDDAATQIRVFNRLLDSAGRGAGVDFYDKVVAPFVWHQATHNQVPAALQALDRARRTLRVEPGSQLEGELNGLTARIKSGNTPKNAPGP